jgi:hypothetical protein
MAGRIGAAPAALAVVVGTAGVLLAGCSGLIPNLRSAAPQGELRIIQGEADGNDLLAEDQGWLCVSTAEVLIASPDLSRVDVEIDQRALASGWVNQGGIRMFVGPARDAAVAMGATVLALGGRDDAWVLVSQTGWELRPIVTPRGHQLLTTANSIRPCGADTNG